MLVEAPTSVTRSLLRNGAGEGNRTLTTSLEGWSSTIELHPLIPKQLPYNTEGATYSGAFFELQPVFLDKFYGSEKGWRTAELLTIY